MTIIGFGAAHSIDLITFIFIQTALNDMMMKIPVKKNVKNLSYYN